MRSPGITEEQRTLLERRGYLEPDQIHRLAKRTSSAVGEASESPDCHSDYVSPESALEIQREKLVQIKVKRKAPAAAPAE
jgi:hypothetical protein